jgi:hypothetical protein
VTTPDLHLRPDSRVRDKGIDVGQTTDADGNAIAGLPDLGSYEYEADFVVVAGPDQYATIGDTVRLDGRRSIGVTSYLWEQVGGESVTLSSSTDSTPTFTAISSSEATFKLTGSNGVDTDSDEVLIVINCGVSSMSYCTNDPAYSGIVASDSITQSGYIDSAITIYREVNMLIVRNAGKHVMELTIDNSSLYGIPLRPKECLTMRVYGTHCPRMYVHMADGESAIVIQRC